MEKKFIVSLWSGCGYCLDSFEVEAFSEYNALDLVVTELIEKEENGRFYLTESEMEEARAAGDVFELGDDEIEGWMHWDATMEGAPYPVWIRTENMIIEAA